MSGPTPERRCVDCRALIPSGANRCRPCDSLHKAHDSTPSIRGEDWRERAACLHADASLFDVVRLGSARVDMTRVRAAKAVCATCPVARQCLAFGQSEDRRIGSGSRDVIYGGLVYEERVGRRMPREPKDTLADLAPCGTRSAYERHRSRGEIPCQPCREAARLYYHHRYQIRRQRGEAS